MIRTKQRGTVIEIDSRRTTRTLMHQEKAIACQLYAFPLKRSKNRRPGVNGNALALPPLLDRVPRSANIGGHRGKRRPALEHIINGAHAAEYAPDGLSDQGPTMIPMTKIVPDRTISPMGRSTTPVKFRAEMAKRLMSARVVAGYTTKKEAADALQIGLDRYEKWESGRTPVPAQYVGPICELFHIDANYLFGVQTSAVSTRKIANTG
jgi:hypothetical protein